ncbi:MAG: hypothetical protein L0215_12360 [Gemmataceae bacterium]|nr:hypothetical protein [Gemmataceae bacterium]
MTLENTLRQKLAEAKPAHTRHDWSVHDEASGWHVYLTADHRDQFTTVAWELKLRRGSHSADLASWADRAAKATGLLESLKVVEVDVGRQEALLRSDQPAERDGRTFYYEVLLQSAGAVLMRRYQGSHQTAKRDQVPFVLTNETLAKLAGVLTA